MSDDPTVTQYLDGFADGSTKEREACADLVGAAGCICWDLYHSGGGEWNRNKELVRHDPRCPIELSATIKARVT